jgi:nucleoid-associated protein YgaU
MTRQHFEKLAEALRNARPTDVFGSRVGTMSTSGLYKMQTQWERDVQAISKVCQSFNPSFDPDRFKQATQEG